MGSFNKSGPAGLPEIRPEFKAKSCTGEPNVLPGIKQLRKFQPYEYAVKLLVAGDLHEIRGLSKSVMRVQETLQEQFRKDLPKTQLLFSVGTFLDNCRHDTNWSSNPTDIGSQSTTWHCYETETMFHEALDAMRDDRQRADLVIMVGNRFDDNVNATARAAEALNRERGTRVFALSGNARAAQKYEQVAKAGGGLHLPLNKGADEYRNLMHEITQVLLNKVTGRDLAALPVPKTKELGQVRLQLMNLG
jgi:hypothetical protein